ncbi:hypothetical protein D6D28_08158 [Aureobasidium pullulans]|uniref:Uncharacterized protein n=1 Tax=Aureobasidium pullulans TaxID=5580 RepID=A0A4S8S8M4_AURPU|nr:hypothetical protein D6D28_08158 [Aureobasidium pullulans]
MDAQEHLESRAREDPVTGMIIGELFSADNVPVHITSLISANYHKIFHLKALRDRGGANVADILRSLEITESSETTTDDETATQTAHASNRQEREDIQTMSLARRCMELRRNICRSYKGPLAEAAETIKAKLEALNCTPLPFCGHHSNLDDLCLLLYAATSAIYHHHTPLLASDHQPTGVMLEFVDFLHLAGGRPASSYPYPCDTNATLDEFVETVRNVHDYLSEVPTWQEGSFDDWDELPAEKEIEGWRFQRAADIEGLDPGSWEKISSGTFKVFMTAARTGRCFIMHIELFWAIKAKQRHLHADGRHGCWTWAIWQTEGANRASEVPYVPLMYMPAFEPDDLPSLSPSVVNQGVVGQSREKKRRLPTRTPEEQAAKKDLAIRLRKRQRG